MGCNRRIPPPKSADRSSGCEAFSHEGSGYGCLVDYDWQVGHKYRLRVWSVGDGKAWLGAIFDYTTQKDTILGTINVPKTWGDGLGSRSVTVTEYVGYQGYPTCGGPYTRAVFSSPLARNIVGDGSPQATIDYSPSTCTNSDIKYVDGQYYVMEVGPGVTRTTTHGTTFGFKNDKPDPKVQSILVNSIYSSEDNARIGIPVKNAGATSLDARVVANVIAPDGKTTVYDSHLVGKDVQLQIPGGDTSIAYFDWKIPAAATEGSYKILYSVREWNNWDSVYTLDWGPSFSVKAAAQGCSANSDVAVSALGRSYSTLTRIPVQNLQCSTSVVHEFSVDVPATVKISKVKQPRGWISEIDSNTVTFSTNDRPIEPGKKFTFRIFASPSIRSFDWIACDIDGNTIAENKTKVRR